MKIKIKRVYEKPAKEDGPSKELREWFDHDPAKWKEFRKRYLQEIKNAKDQRSLLKEEMKKGMVTLVYGSKDEEHNEALVLKELFNR